MVKFKAKVIKIGNSIGIIIPKNVREYEMNIKKDDILTIDLGSSFNPVRANFLTDPIFAVYPQEGVA